MLAHRIRYHCNYAMGKYKYKYKCVCRVCVCVCMRACVYACVCVCVGVLVFALNHFPRRASRCRSGIVHRALVDRLARVTLVNSVLLAQ